MSSCCMILEVTKLPIKAILYHSLNKLMGEKGASSVNIPYIRLQRLPPQWHSSAVVLRLSRSSVSCAPIPN